MRRKGAQGLTVDLPLLPPNTHRNPNKIICELCLEVEEERKRSRLHILHPFSREIKKDAEGYVPVSESVCDLSLFLSFGRSLSLS